MLHMHCSVIDLEVAMALTGFQVSDVLPWMITHRHLSSHKKKNQYMVVTMSTIVVQQENKVVNYIFRMFKNIQRNPCTVI